MSKSNVNQKNLNSVDFNAEQKKAFKKFCKMISDNPHYLEKGLANDEMIEALDKCLKDFSEPTRQMFGLDIDDIEKYYNWDFFSSSVYVWKVANNVPEEFFKEKEKLLAMYKEPIDVIKNRQYCESMVYNYDTDSLKEISAEYKIALAEDIAHFKSLTNLFNGYFEDIVADLQRDANPQVRTAIAKQGYFDLLQNDPSPTVQKAMDEYKKNDITPGKKLTRDRGMDI